MVPHLGGRAEHICKRTRHAWGLLKHGNGGLGHLCTCLHLLFESCLPERQLLQLTCHLRHELQEG